VIAVWRIEVVTLKSEFPAERPISIYNAFAQNTRSGGGIYHIVAIVSGQVASHVK